MTHQPLFAPERIIVRRDRLVLGVLGRRKRRYYLYVIRCPRCSFPRYASNWDTAMEIADRHIGFHYEATNLAGMLGGDNESH